LEFTELQTQGAHEVPQLVTLPETKQPPQVSVGN